MTELSVSEKGKVLFLGINADYPDKQRIPIRHNGSHIYSDLAEIPSKDLEDLYQEGYYGEKVDSSVNKSAINIFQKERQFLATKGISPGKVLDVGCGDGTFLDHLPQTWSKYGFEPSDAGQTELKRKGIAFLDVNNCESEHGTFDLITMWHSLEHVDDPGMVLEQLKHLLKDDGVLFVSVPNFNSLQAQIFKARWFHLDPTRHLHHFTWSSLETLVKSKGYQIISKNTLSLEYNLYGWWQSFFNFLPFDFNFAYKILKGRKNYPKTMKYKLAKLLVLIVAVPNLILSGCCFLVEAFLNKGGVLNIKIKKERS